MVDAGIEQPMVAAFHALRHLSLQPGQSIGKKGLIGWAVLKFQSGEAVRTGVERTLVVDLAELGARIEIGMLAKALAIVPVAAEVVPEIITLEDAVVRDDPVVLLGDERLDDGGRDLRVIGRRQRVADIV